MEQKVVDAINNLKHLADRWDTTPEWHADSYGKKDFTGGEIHITTGDLQQLSILIKHHKQVIIPRCDQCGFGTENEKTATGMRMRLCDRCEPNRSKYEQRYADHCMTGN